MSGDIFNFSAGPAVIPKSVIKKLKSEITNFDRGMLKNMLKELNHL